MIHNISDKTLIGAKPLRIRFDKIDRFIRIYDGNGCLVLFMKNMMPFTIGLLLKKVVSHVFFFLILCENQS